MRICLYAGPGAGKSTTAAWLFSQLKMQDYDIELVTEYVKQWTYTKRLPVGFEQMLILANQLHREDLVIRAGYKHLVTDSPLLVGCFYSILYKVPIYDELISISNKFESDHESLNIFLDREDQEYDTTGRFQTYEEALQVDNDMKTFLQDQLDELHCIPAFNKADIYNLVIKNIKG